MAAVAASVLIFTSGHLQQRALATGRDTEEGVATGADIFSIIASDGTDGGVDTFEALLRLSAGSQSLKLNSSLFILDTKDSFQQIIFGGYNTAGDTDSFNVSYLQNGTDNQVGYLSEGDPLRSRRGTAEIQPSPLTRGETSS